MTQSLSRYQQTQQEIAELRLETERKFNQLLTDVIITSDTVRELAVKVDRLVEESAVERAERVAEAASDRAEWRAGIESLASEAASDRIEFREQITRVLQQLSDRHSGNGSTQ